MPSQRERTGWNALDVLGSPIFNILDTVSNLPYVNETGLNDWLYDTPATQGVQNFQAESPGGAFAADIVASFVPYVGWGGALNKAAALGRTGGILGATNRLRTGAAGLFPNSPIMAFAAGETAAYAPLSLGITALDVGAGNYDSPGDAAFGFVAGNLLGGGVQALGHGLSPLVQRAFPASARDLAAGRNDSLIGGGWKTVFEPGPALSALYGFSGNIRSAAAAASRIPAVQAATDPTLMPQQRAQYFYDLREQIREAQALAAAGKPVPDDRLLTDGLLELMDNQYSAEVVNILNRELDPVETSFHFSDRFKPSARVRNTLDAINRVGPSNNGHRVRMQLSGSGTSIRNPDVLAETLELPDGWIHNVDLPGVTQAVSPSAVSFQKEVGLDPSPMSGPALRLHRTTPKGQDQVWAAWRSEDGTWQMTTKIPGDHTMSGRQQFPTTQHLNANEKASAFLSFKTTNPAMFIDDLKIDWDNPGPKARGLLEDRIPRGKSDFLDKLMDFRQVYLGRETMVSTYNALRGSPDARRKFTQAVLEGPTAGKDMMNWLDEYTAPSLQQLKNSPEGRAILGTVRAALDAAEGRAKAILHGVETIPDGKSALASLFSNASIDDKMALIPNLRRVYKEDPGTLELIRKFNNGDFELDAIKGTKAHEWLELALKVNEIEIGAIDGMIDALRDAGATSSKLIPTRKNHFGLSHRWDGSTVIPIHLGTAVKPDTVIAGKNLADARAKAQKWLAARALDPKAKGEGPRRMGQPFVVGLDQTIPPYLDASVYEPGLIKPREGIMGWEHQYEPYKHLNDLVDELENGYLQRWRYGAFVGADALTGGKLNYLKTLNPQAYKIVQGRISQLHGDRGPIDKRLNQIVDGMLPTWFGSNNASKIAQGLNEFNFHMLHGALYPGTSALNMTSILQTQVPAGIEFLTLDPNQLRGLGYHLPSFDPQGVARPGFNFISDPIALMWGGFKKAMTADPETKAIFEELFRRKIMATGLPNEYKIYTGNDRTIAQAAGELKDPADVLQMLKMVSSIMMTKSEQISRTISSGISLQAQEMYAKAWGLEFTTGQKIDNAATMVERSNYSYMPQDRPGMYTGPLGAIFGNQKTWMTNYMFMMFHYLGLASKGNWAPLAFSLGTTTALGGVFALPLIGMGIDAYTEAFADQDAREFIHDRMGEGGNAISFGLPALFGVSFSGNVSAPGSNLAHDSEFFFSIVALERAKLMGRALGRGWDDQVTLGMNPFSDQVFQQQLMQGFTPRSFYRSWESLTQDTLRSAATGYPLVQEFGLGARILHSLGFRDTDIAIQYAAYESMLKDRDAMRRQIALFGEAYANASMNNDRAQMTALLQQAAVAGLDINSVMRSAQVRMRNAGKDMFGRNFNQEQLERYQRSLEAGGRDAN